MRGFGSVCLEMPGDTDGDLNRAQRPHLLLADRFSNLISTLQASRSEFDALLIFLPGRWSKAFRGQRDEDFDLHDYLKSVCAMRCIPLQILREDRSLQYACRASVMWRLGLATYCKAGGVPWKLFDSGGDTAFIGLGYAIKKVDGRTLFVTCCSQVFDADGVGLEFVVFETEEFRQYGENPFLTRDGMRRLMSRSLRLYQQRHAGRSPKHVIVHKTTEFRDPEIHGCLDAWRSVEALDLVQIQQDSAWRGIQIDAYKQPGNYPCGRGNYLPLSGTEALLWTPGNAGPAIGTSNYYKEGKGIPSPLLLVRFSGHSSWEVLCRGILGLSKMNWNNDGLYDRLPVTVEYASILARTVKRMPHLPTKPYEFRYFM